MNDHTIPKECSDCGLTKEAEDYPRTYHNEYSRQPYCSKCQYKRQSIRFNKIKLKAINYLGGHCIDCNGEYQSCCYDFHHRDPLKKEFMWIKLKNRAWEKITKELDKCDLLCSNCHRIRHHTHVP